MLIKRFTAGVIILLCVLGVVGCRQQSVSSCDVEIHRLDKVFSEYATLDSFSRAGSRKEYGDVIDLWFKLQGYDVVDDSALIRYSNSRPVEIFTADIKTRFNSLDSVSKILAILDGSACNKLCNNFLLPIYTVVSPYNQSVFISDTVMFVGLNHYLGYDYPGYGYFEPYQRQVKTSAHLPYDIAEASIANKYPYIQNIDATVLNSLLYNGAVVYAIMQLMPDASLAEVLGYTPEQMKWVENNEREAWNAMVSRGLLYSTSSADVSRLISPSPVTSILHHESPGRMGRYIGYKIVKSYIDVNENISLSKLLSPEFYNSQQSLIDAGYSAN